MACSFRKTTLPASSPHFTHFTVHCNMFITKTVHWTLEYTLHCTLSSLNTVQFNIQYDLTSNINTCNLCSAEYYSTQNCVQYNLYHIVKYSLHYSGSYSVQLSVSTLKRRQGGYISRKNMPSTFFLSFYSKDLK